MKLTIFVFLIAILAGGVVAFMYFVVWPAVKPAFGPAPYDVKEVIPREMPQRLLTPTAVNETNIPLRIPDGFRVSLFTKDPIGSLRMMAFSPDGILFVSMSSKGALYAPGASGRDGKIFAMPDRDLDGKADEVKTVLADLNRPHGIAFYEGYLYVAEENGVSRYPYKGGMDVGDREDIVENLPAGDGHITRTIGFTFGKMYVSIGSSCNVCVEKDRRRAAVMEFNPDGSDGRIFAEGLRNAVGLVFNPKTLEMWVTDNGRDWLGDDLPPEEINIVRDGKHYGWPYCYGDNIPDPFGADIPASLCIGKVGSVFDMQAHSAPLGLRFISSSQFPKSWQGDLLVAYHGSWNRSEPTGYKVVRLDVEGSKILGEEDFISGWLLQGGAAVGRPVDVIFDPSDGTLYISDDKAGVIYRVTKL